MVDKVKEDNMTLVVTILTICLVLALVAGVIETCIASWMIRRYKNVRSKDSAAQSAAENAERRYQSASNELQENTRLHKEKLGDIVTNLLMPNRSAIMKTCKASAKTEEKAKAKAILKTLNEIQMSVEDEKAGEWLSSLTVEISDLIGAEL